MRRKILNVIETLGLGGAERLLLTTHRHLDRTRFELSVACLFGPNVLARELRALGVPVYELGLSGPRDLPLGVLRLRRLIRRERFEVVHTHLYYANVTGRLAAWRNARLATTLHNPDYTYEDPGTLLFRGKKLLDHLTGRFLNHALVAVSREVCRDVEEHLGFRGIQVIPNCIDVKAHEMSLARFDRSRVREELGLKDADIAVLHVGRFHLQKGQDLLVDGFAKASRQIPGLKLILVGQGNLRAAVEERVRAAGLSDVVHFTGPLETVTPYYRLADIFVFPSRYEAFGIALLEAMAAGLPVVAFRAGGICELATADSAMLVPVGDTDALAAGIVSLAKDRTRRMSMGAAARDRARQFDVHCHIGSLEALYASL